MTAVLLEIKDGIATLTLNRPQALNSLSSQMMSELAQAGKKLVGNDSVEVVIVNGAGEHFMAGGDVKGFHQLTPLPGAERMTLFRREITQCINSIVNDLRGLHQPVICSVQGACAGFGLSLMLSCDLVVAADNAYFTTAYSHIALSPDGGQTFFLPRIVGMKKATELLMLADRFSAQEALQWGLINRVVPAAELAAETLKLAQRIQKGPRHAYGEAKQLLNRSYETSLAAQLQNEADAFSRCAATEDFAEGVSAFVEKRKAVFKGK